MSWIKGLFFGGTNSTSSSGLSGAQNALGDQSQPAQQQYNTATSMSQQHLAPQYTAATNYYGCYENNKTYSVMNSKNEVITDISSEEYEIAMKIGIDASFNYIKKKKDYNDDFDNLLKD